MVEVEGLTKEFRGRRRRKIRALRGISFECLPGQIFGLLGRNGAGKTTTLRILATILSPTSGTVRVRRLDVTRTPAAVRRLIGFQTGDTRLYDRLSGREALHYFGRLEGMSDASIRERVAALAERYELMPFIDRHIGTLSNGQKQRLSLVRAVMHDPVVLLLDEPTAGLDILAARETLILVRSLRDEGRTILFSTHILSEVERICDVVGILDCGTMLACDRVDAIRQMGRGDLETAFVELVRGDQEDVS